MEIELKGTDIGKAISENIINQLGEEGRKEVINQALQKVFEDREEKDGYSTKKIPSMMVQAFDVALEKMTRDVIFEFVEKDDRFKKIIEKLVSDAVDIILQDKNNEWDIVRTVSKSVAAVLVGAAREASSKLGEYQRGY